MKLKLSISLLLLFVSGILFAQNTRLERQKLLQEKKKSFITEKLALTPAESEKFWPLYESFEKKNKELKLQFRKLNKPVNLDSLGSKEASELLAKKAETEMAILQNRHQFLNQIKTTLSPQRALKMLEIEKDFKKSLLKQLNKNQMKRLDNQKLED